MAGPQPLKLLVQVRPLLLELWPWCSGSACCAVNAAVPDRNRAVTQFSARGVLDARLPWEQVLRWFDSSRADGSRTQARPRR